MMRRRDRQSEILVALLVIGAMAFALAFGVLLSLGDQSDEDNDTATESVTATQRTSTVEIAVVPDRTDEVILTEEATSESMETIEASPTQTPVEIQATETSEVVITQSPSPESTETLEASPTRTPTDFPALSFTATPTKMPSRTPTEQTALTVTDTKSPTATRKPSNTPTLTNTVSPTATPSLTHTPTRQVLFPITFTPTRTATGTPTQTPTLTPTLTTVPLITVVVPTESPPPTMVCVQPADWQVYIIQKGDTFFSIARTFNVSQQELAAANCLTNTSVIYAGEPLLVPPTAFNIEDAAIQKCDNPNVQITSPLPGQALDGFVTLRGIATGPAFRRYVIDWRPDDPAVSFRSFAEVYENKPTESDLAVFNTDAFPPGLYWFNLFALDEQDNLIGDCAIRVRFN